MLFMPKGLIGLWDLFTQKFRSPAVDTKADAAAAE
jgi:hypothetical protein